MSREKTLRLQFANADRRELAEEVLMRELPEVDFYVRGDQGAAPAGPGDVDEEGEPKALFVDVLEHAVGRVKGTLLRTLRPYRLLVDVAVDDEK